MALIVTWIWGSDMKDFWKAHSPKIFTGIILAIYAIYLVSTVQSAARLITTGEAVPVLMGICVLGIPLVGVWILIREVRFGATTQAMAKELREQNLLPEDNLPRLPSGRIVRQAADADFVQYKEEAEANPGRWQSWHRLALAYDAAGDRRRARDAMKTAMKLRSADLKANSARQAR